VGVSHRDRLAYLGHRGLRYRADHLSVVGTADFYDPLLARSIVHNAVLSVASCLAPRTSRWFIAMSRISKLRSRFPPSTPVTARLKRRGTTCSETPPCERSGASRPERSCRAALVPRTTCFVETTTRSPTRSGGSSKRRHASALVSTSWMPSIAPSF